MSNHLTRAESVHPLRSRIAFAAWCPALYLLTLVLIGAAFSALLDSADDLSDLFGYLFVGLFVFGIGGHIVYGLVVSALIPAPRRGWRILVLTVGTPVFTLTTGAMAPVSLVALAPIVASSALGYWAAEPREVVSARPAARPFETAHNAG